MALSSRAARVAHLTADIRIGACLGIIGAALAAGLFALASEPVATARPAQQDGKASDRLAFVADESDALVRETRIYDTLAMFALPQAEAGAWSEAPRVVATAAETGIGPTVPRASSTPRMVAAEASVARRMPEVPPVRPARLAAVGPAVSPSPKVMAWEDPEPARTPLRLLGVGLPGTEYLPTRRDAVRTANTIGGKAVAIGTGTASFVTATASAVGDGVSSLGDVIADGVGLR